MPDQLIRLFEPGAAPLRGMRSYPVPESLPKGIFSQLTNVRCDRLALQVRSGASLLSTGGPITGSPALRGAYQGVFGGQSVILAAYRVGSFTEVWHFNTFTGAWDIEVTGDGTGINGAFAGNTRFPTDGPVTFTPGRTPGGLDVIVISNGEDPPRVYNANRNSLFRGKTCVIHQAVPVPQALNALTAQLTWPEQADLQTTITMTTTGYNYLWLSQNTPDTSPVVQIKTTSGSTIPSNFSWTNALNISNSKYLVLICTSGTPATPSVAAVPGTPLMWNQIEVCAWDGTSGNLNPGTTHNQAVWSPLHSEFAPVYIPDIDPNDPYKFAVAFSLAGQTLTDACFTAMEGLVFFLNDASLGPVTPPLSVSTCTILGVFGDGQVPGGSQYGLSYYDSGSFAESYGQVITNLSTQTFNAPTGSPYVGLQIPNSELLNYVVNVQFQMVTAPQIQAGNDSVGIYRLDPGEVQYDLVQYYTVATFTNGTPGSWVTSTAGTIVTYVDTTPTSNKNPNVLLPSAYQLPIPIGTCTATSNGRVYVGGVSGTNGSRSDVYISYFLNPFRYTQAVQFINASQPDLYSSVLNTFMGEIVTNLEPIAGTLVGVDTIFVTTNQNCYLFEGSDSISLSRPARVLQGHGCPITGAICNQLGAIFFVDDEQQVRSFKNGQTSRISRLKIDDKLANGTFADSTMACAYDGIYLSYIPVGGTAYTNLLRYDEMLGEWVEDSLAVGDAQILLQSTTLPNRVLYAFSLDGNIYQLETPGQTTDAGTAIPVTLMSGALHDGMWNRVTCREAGITCDTGSEVLSVNRVWRNLWNNAGNNGQFNLANAVGNTSQLWETLLDSNSQSIMPGGTGLSVQIGVIGNLPGGFNFYSLIQKFESQPKDDARPG